KLVAVATDTGGPSQQGNVEQRNIRGRGFFPDYALVNPRAQQANLFRPELVALAERRHFHVLHQVGDILNERTFGAVARDDVRALVPTLQCIRAVVEPEVALGLLGAVAPQTRGVQNRLYITGKINLVGGRGRQLGFINGGCRKQREARKKGGAQASPPKLQRQVRA